MPQFNNTTYAVEKPGNFIVTDIHVIPYHREGEEGIFRQIITDQVIEFSIYESVESPFLTGDMTIVDGYKKYIDEYYQNEYESLGYEI